MDNKDMQSLINTFKEYRDLLTPLQNNLQSFADTYHSLRTDIEKINIAFEGDIKGNLEEIYKTLSSQAEKATDLSSRIDKFIDLSNSYTKNINKFISVFERVAERMEAVHQIEVKAEEQIGKLDAIIEEKKKSYNVRDLQRSLSSYNENVQKISEFINKDIAQSINQNHEKLSQIKNDNENIIDILVQENSSLEILLNHNQTTNDLLKKIIENKDVNEEYIFDIIDNWAANRKVKTKK